MLRSGKRKGENNEAEKGTIVTLSAFDDEWKLRVSVRLQHDIVPTTRLHCFLVTLSTGEDALAIAICTE